MTIYRVKPVPGVIIQFRDPTEEELADYRKLTYLLHNETPESPAYLDRKIIAEHDLGQALIVGGCDDQMACLVIGRAMVVKHIEAKETQ